MSAMRLALGLSVHTGWAAAVVAGGDWEKPVVVLRERVELLGNDERFLFHRAAEMTTTEALKWVSNATTEAVMRATVVMKRLAATHGVKACAVVAKKGAMPPLEEAVAAHPRIHTAEGCFYRDVLVEAAEAAGLQAVVIVPKELDTKDERLVQVGKVVGKPWSVDWKLAVMGAWRVA
jgi:hypothetical protein